MANGVDIGFIIAVTVSMILRQLSLPLALLVVCMDLLSLYNCVVKLGTTREKRFMINIMVLRKMYEKKELIDMYWISGNSNPADTMTKASLNRTI